MADDAPAPGAVPAPPAKKKFPVWIIVLLGCGCGGFLVIGILAAILMPAIVRAKERAQATSCANNLSQLWRMQVVYSAQFGGRMKEMPDKTGEAFWMALSRTSPPLIDETSLDIYLCPLRGDSSPGRCDYRGPAKRVSEAGEADPVGADKDGNHRRTGGGNVLLKDGSVTEHDATSPVWRDCATKLSP